MHAPNPHFQHEHGHAHAHHAEQAKEVRQVTWLGLWVNLALSAIKTLAGTFGGSMALVADGLHSLSDTASDIAIIVGSRFWSAPPDEKHTYGHKRIETLVSMGIGISVAIVGLFMLLEGIDNLRSGNYSQPTMLAAWAAGIGIITKEALYQWTMYKNKSINSPALAANAWHHRSDAFSSFPVLIAIVGTLLFPQFQFLDSVGAMVVASFILRASYEITKPSMREIMDASVPPETYEALQKQILTHKKIESIHELRTRYVGQNIFIDFHAVVGPDMTVKESHDVVEEVMEDLHAHFPEVEDILIHVDPHDDRKEQGKEHITF
jgi:cation diffusion facilitator family transporter